MLLTRAYLHQCRGTEWRRRMHYVYTWWVETTDLASDILEYVAAAHDDLEFIDWT